MRRVLTPRVLTPRIPAILAAVLILTGCGGTSKPRPASTRARSSVRVSSSIRVSSDFGPGAPIPRGHTCDGRDVSPPLRAPALPAGTRELVVVMLDPDAPGGDFIHWGLAHLAPSGQSMSLPGGARPAGAVLGRNSFGSLGYRGPCPPAGPAHHYHITVYALGRPSGLSQGFSAGAVSGVPVLGQGTLIGTYARR
jgi:Raf kinase inhibitor-like YbhB/YbcL family protein